MIKIHTLPAQGMVVKNDDEKSIPSRGARKPKKQNEFTQHPKNKKNKNTQLKPNRHTNAISKPLKVLIEL